MKLFEVIAWPQTIDSDELVNRIMELHHSPIDFEEGDLIDRIQEHSHYILTRLPLDAIELDEFLVDEIMVDDYRQLLAAGMEPPPIIYDSVNKTIIDGTHRANAAVKAGAHDIAAYVPADE